MYYSKSSTDVYYWLTEFYLKSLSDVVRSACLEVSIAPPLHLIPRALRSNQTEAQAGQHQAAHNVHLHWDLQTFQL